MKAALVASALAALGLPVLSAETGALDIGTMLASYGIAAPFAGLCLLQMSRVQKKSDEKDDVIAEKDAKIERLQNEAVHREKEFASRLAPLLLDGAQLYRQGNERLARSVPPAVAGEQDIHELAEQIANLAEQLGKREAP